MDEKEKRKIALKSVFVASLVFFIFAIFGGDLLDLLGVNIESFRAAGGIILVLLGIQMSLGLSLPKENGAVHEIAVIIGTPLITGPATITTTILLVKESGLITTLMAGSGALLITMVALLLSTHLSRIIGVIGVRILSTIMGIITIAWGLQFIMIGISNFGIGS